eukprot:1654293-Rhodomonas_salina.1
MWTQAGMQCADLTRNEVCASLYSDHRNAMCGSDMKSTVRIYRPPGRDPRWNVVMMECNHDDATMMCGCDVPVGGGRQEHAPPHAQAARPSHRLSRHQSPLVLPPCLAPCLPHFPPSLPRPLAPSLPSKLHPFLPLCSSDSHAHHSPRPFQLSCSLLAIFAASLVPLFASLVPPRSHPCSVLLSGTLHRRCSSATWTPPTPSEGSCSPSLAYELSSVCYPLSSVLCPLSALLVIICCLFPGMEPSFGSSSPQGCIDWTNNKASQDASLRCRSLE